MFMVCHTVASQSRVCTRPDVLERRPYWGWILLGSLQGGELDIRIACARLTSARDAAVQRGFWRAGQGEGEFAGVSVHRILAPVTASSSSEHSVVLRPSLVQTRTSWTINVDATVLTLCILHNKASTP